MYDDRWYTNGALKARPVSVPLTLPPVSTAVRTPRFGREQTGNRGSYLSDVILEVLAVHMGVVLQAEKSFGRPAGALALVCAAVERALDGWKGGVNAIEEAKKDAKLNKGLGFKADRWGPVAARWLKGIDKNMTEKRWDILIRDTAIFIPDRLSNDFDFELFAEGDIHNIDGSGDEFLEQSPERT